MGKRKSEENDREVDSKSLKKAKTGMSEADIRQCFNPTLFEAQVLENYTTSHARSEPYKHCVIHKLMEDGLLRKVRDEIREHVQFTPKETDIYKIHQSGDLANLDGLDDAALDKLPSLLKLRDALYSPAFRKYVAQITGSDELSGKKTDMAINVYTPGCHLLCHDDVIGSRRVSYILYLTDPDIPWKEEWGGALRLFPTIEAKSEDGEVATRIPSPYHCKSIPPAWNQLSFFTVQPGLSFHDVEEVYHAESKEQLEKEGGRVRMAISGWYHIPQEGEDGYDPGMEEKLAERSSLTQLQKADAGHDYPKDARQPVPKSVAQGKQAAEEKSLEQEDIEFLLQYLAPSFLTPDMMEQMSAYFEEHSSIELASILSAKFAQRVRAHIAAQEDAPWRFPEPEQTEHDGWQVARPPHKHRYLYLQAGDAKEKPTDPVRELVEVLLPSPHFIKWLEVASGCEIDAHNVLARRFRRGVDYTLATSHDGEAQLELSIGLTPTPGWGADDEVDDADSDDGESKQTNGKAAASNRKPPAAHSGDDPTAGGHEVYMASDEDGDGDAAIYKTAQGADDEDDNILFTAGAAWNKLSLVLRDSGVLRFTKYVSRGAKGDRWDVCGTYGVVDEEDDDDDEEDGGENQDDDGEEKPFVITEKSDDEFQGFSASEDDSDSD